MARIAGIELKNNLAVEIALTDIYGIGRPLSRQILAQVGVINFKKVGELSEDDIVKLRSEIEGKYRVEGQLRQEIRTNIKRLKDIRSWRGVRHEKRLPVRGQTTKTNSRTIRGNVRITASGTSSKRSQAAPT